MGRKEHKIKKVKKMKSSDIGVLKCPCCGAPLASGSDKNTTCSYCGVSIVFSDKLLINNDKSLTSHESIIKEYKPNETIAPCIEEINNEYRKKHKIIKISKNEKKFNLNDEKCVFLVCLGITAIGGLSYHLAVNIEPKNETLFYLRFLLGVVGIFLASSGIFATGYTAFSHLGVIDSEKKYDEKGSIK